MSEKFDDILYRQIENGEIGSETYDDIIFLAAERDRLRTLCDQGNTALAEMRDERNEYRARATMAEGRIGELEGELKQEEEDPDHYCKLVLKQRKALEDARDELGIVTSEGAIKVDGISPQKVLQIVERELYNCSSCRDSGLIINKLSGDPIAGGVKCDCIDATDALREE